MVTLIKYGALGGGEKYNVNQMWIDGLSTDSKPTTTIDGMGIPNGSAYTEVDTGKTYMFDKENTTWYEVSIGGGGGTSGGIVLVGETTTALTDNATTNPITVNGQSYTAQPNDAVIYGNKEFLFDGTKWHEFGDLSGLASKDIGAMTGYAKAQTAGAIGTSDTLNQAIGKVEKRVDDNENNISKQQDTTEQGGNGYAIINGQRLYMGSETQPPIPPQSIWLYNGVKIKSINYFDTDNYGLVPVSSSAERNGTNCGILPPGQYTLSATVSTSHSQLYRTIKNGDNYTLDTILSLPYTFTADGTSEQIIRVAGTDKNSWSDEGYSNIMLNTGDTAETYIDYWT